MAYIVCTSNLDLVSFLFVPALYSTLKLVIFPFIYIYIYIHVYLAHKRLKQTGIDINIVHPAYTIILTS